MKSQEDSKPRVHIPVLAATIYGYSGKGIEIEIAIKVKPNDFVGYIKIPFTELFGDDLKWIRTWPKFGTMECNMEDITEFTSEGIIFKLGIFMSEGNTLWNEYFIKYSRLLDGKGRIKKLSTGLTK